MYDQTPFYKTTEFLVVATISFVLFLTALILIVQLSYESKCVQAAIAGNYTAAEIQVVCLK